MNKQETIELLQKQLPGFYSVEQVIKMISEIEDDSTEVVSDEVIENIVDEIVDLDLNLIEDYELSMNYREVELDSVSISADRIERTIRKFIGKD